MAEPFCLFDDISQTWNQKKQNSVVKKIVNASCSLSALTAEALSYAPSTSINATVTSKGSSAASNGIGTVTASLSVSHDKLTGVIMHQDTLKAIWKKPESLVGNPILIVSVPGGANSNSRMVASSTGDYPHIVTTPTKFTGQFKCDSKCPMYATYKVCAHTIATAEVSGKLLSFVQWLNKQKRSPNLTGLSMIGISNAAAGKKGGIQKRRQKRKVVSTAAKPIVDRLSVTSPSTSSFSDASSSFPNGSSIPALASSLTSTYPSSLLTQPSLTSSCAQPLYSSGGNVSTPMQITPVTTEPRQQWNLQPSQTYNIMLPSTESPPHQLWNLYVASTQPNHVFVPPHLPTSVPFTLKFLNLRIKICQGCRNLFHPLHDTPPYNLVVFRKECRPYRQVGIVKTPSVLSNAHYHITLSCIRAAEPSFLPSQLVIPPDVAVNLSNEHKQYISLSLGISV